MLYIWKWLKASEAARWASRHSSAFKIGGFAIPLVVAVVLAVYVFPRILAGGSTPFTPGDALRAKAENDVRGTLLTALGAFIVGGVAYLSYRLNQRGQVTDRFTKAIDQLGQEGKDKLDIRIGGIYALEQIARDSSKLHWPIMAVLTAFIREHRPWSSDWPTESADEVGADIQAALTVIGQRKAEHDHGVLDLNSTNLRGAKLIEANLNGADLNEADLQGADLTDAKLKGADLRRANLQGADLENTQLQYAYLDRASLQGTSLVQTNLRQANLHEANLKGTDALGVNFAGAHMLGANLQGAHLVMVDLRRTNLSHVDLKDARFEASTMEGAYLADANLQGADLRGSNLRSAYVFGTNLSGANLQGADLRGSNLEDAKGGPADVAPRHSEGPDASDKGCGEKHL